MELANSKMCTAKSSYTISIEIHNHSVTEHHITRRFIQQYGFITATFSFPQISPLNVPSAPLRTSIPWSNPNWRPQHHQQYSIYRDWSFNAVFGFKGHLMN
jgi:hypothetical protein